MSGSEPSRTFGGPGRLLALGLLLFSALAWPAPRSGDRLVSGAGGGLQGRLTDMATGAALAGVSVRAGGLQSTSDRFGEYSLDLPSGTYDVRFDAPGYGGATAIDTGVAESGVARLDVALPPAAEPALRSLAFPLDSRRQPTEEDRSESQSLLPSAVPAEPVSSVPPTIRVLMPDGELREMDTEEYVKGVVPAEMGYLYRRGPEALKAQAIAARTYAAGSCLPETAGDPSRCEPELDANVDTTTRTQAWRPIHYDVSDAAVEATRGCALASGGELIRSLYFSRTYLSTLASEDSRCCGGRTIDYLRSVSSPDAFDELRGHGAGMSQEGAAVFADWGAQAEEIVGYYYAGASVACPAAATPRPTDGTEPAEPTPTVSAAATAAAGSAPTASTALTLAGKWAVGIDEMRVTGGVAEVSAAGVAPASPSGLELEGPQSRADFPFMAVGASWYAAGPAGDEMVVSVRTSRDEKVWSEWQDLPHDHHDEKEAPPAGEYWSSLVFTDGRYLQARLRLPGGTAAQHTTLSGLSVYYLNTEHGPSAPQVAAVGAPTVIERTVWGADESYRFDSGGDEIWPPEYIDPRAQVVHHTVTANGPGDPAAVVRAIYYYHAVTRGWGDIGYNFLVDHRGNVYEGRYGGESVEGIVAGGHAREFNSVSIGIALLGTFTELDSRPSAVAESSLVEMLSHKGRRYGIDPEAPVTLLDGRYPHGVLGHRDVGQTACPGDGVYSRLTLLRSWVAARMKELGPAEPVEPTVEATDPPTAAPASPTPPASPMPPASTATALPSPTTWRPTVAPTATTWRPTVVPTATAGNPACPNLVIAGGFELQTALWRRNRAFYTRWDVYSGEAAMFVGLRDDDPDEVLSYSSVGQTLRLPPRIDSARLVFYARAVGEESDRRLVRVYDGEGRLVALDEVFLEPNDRWTRYEFNLAPAVRGLAGQELQVYFGVVNDGDGSRSFVRLDDVSLRVCPAIGAETPHTATPVEPPTAPGGTPTAAPSPTPGRQTGELVCDDFLEDGGFESSGWASWTRSGGVPPELIASPAYDGSGAAFLGLSAPSVEPFVYSAIGQRTRLPPGVVSATLSLWLRPVRQSPEDAILVEMRRPTTGDRRVLVGPAPASPQGRWSRFETSIDPTAWGRDLEIYIGVLNRGSLEETEVTSAVVDQVSFRVCHLQMEHVYLPSLGQARR